jgi:putative NADH-flavin reductase
MPLPSPFSSDNQEALKFVVMGASGHIGSVIVEDLLTRKETVLALIYSPEKSSRPGE